MRSEQQERFDQWRISLPDGSWKRIDAPDNYNRRGGPHEVELYRRTARGLGIEYEPVVQRRVVRRLKVTVTTTTDTPDQWVSVGGEPQ